jgi:hypothetical protein
MLETGWGGMDWILIWRRTLVNTVMNLQVP